MFSEEYEDLKWLGLDDNKKNLVKLSNKNKSLKHIGEYDKVSMRLNNKSQYKDKTYKVTVKSIKSDESGFRIGVFNSGGPGSDIYYESSILTEYNPFILENGHAIKPFPRKLRADDSLTIIDRCVKTAEGNEKLHFLSIIFNNENEPLFNTFYQAKRRKQLWLILAPGTEVEVDVKSKIYTISLHFQNNL